MRPARFVLSGAGLEGKLVAMQEEGRWIKTWPDGVHSKMNLSETILCDLLQEARRLLCEALQACNSDYVVVQGGNAFLDKTSVPVSEPAAAVNTMPGNEAKEAPAKAPSGIPPLVNKLFDAMLALYDASTHFEEGSESQETLKNWAFEIHAFLTRKSK